eukprot:GEMP01023421.1.p1 GENE.GEMP01023421.1~~GEMP01023421.1.p1  ORF type:complete len:450 (+),score=92.22 GEMP01023421.1:163-1512(+)
MEIEELQEYLKEYKIEDLMLELTEAMLKDRPADPKRYLYERLSQDEGVPEWGRHLGLMPKSLVGNAIMDVPGHHLIRLFESTRSITAEIVPKETINIIIQETIKLLNCDRVSLFVYDKKTNWLVISASNLNKPIRVQPGQGIAGHVFQTQDSVNIPDCYEDARFDASFDKSSGYRTKSMLVMPIIDFEGESVGALQAINKVDNGEFNQVDELIMGHLTQHAGIALRNSEVYRDAITANERANGLLNMIQSLSQDLGTQSTILTVTTHANSLVQADRCTVFLVDEAKGQLWSVSTDSGKEIRIPRTAGIAGEACQEKKIINIPNAYEDPRFNQAIDKRTGYHTQSILAIPVVDSHMRSLAVIQMINKKDFDDVVGQFSDEDVRTMETFAKLVASKLATSTLLKGTQVASGAKKSEGDATFGEMAAPDRRQEKEKRAEDAILEEEYDDEME